MLATDSSFTCFMELPSQLQLFCISIISAPANDLLKLMRVSHFFLECLTKPASWNGSRIQLFSRRGTGINSFVGSKMHTSLKQLQNLEIYDPSADDYSLSTILAHFRNLRSLYVWSPFLSLHHYELIAHNSHLSQLQVDVRTPDVSFISFFRCHRLKELALCSIVTSALAGLALISNLKLLESLVLYGVDESRGAEFPREAAESICGLAELRRLRIYEFVLCHGWNGFPLLNNLCDVDLWASFGSASAARYFGSNRAVRSWSFKEIIDVHNVPCFLSALVACKSQVRCLSFQFHTAGPVLPSLHAVGDLPSIESLLICKSDGSVELPPDVAMSICRLVNLRYLNLAGVVLSRGWQNFPSLCAIESVDCEFASDDAARCFGSNSACKEWHFVRGRGDVFVSSLAECQSRVELLKLPNPHPNATLKSICQLHHLRDVTINVHDMKRDLADEMMRCTPQWHRFRITSNSETVSIDKHRISDAILALPQLEEFDIETACSMFGFVDDLCARIKSKSTPVLCSLRNIALLDHEGYRKNSRVLVTESVINSLFELLEIVPSIRNCMLKVSMSDNVRTICESKKSALLANHPFVLFKTRFAFG